ncbi:MAG: UvrD-helicase domain-containing protein [Flavobacteriaceae bacterium]|nr:UvrD-helicase domain-containing protein [Flavobacteriaceae bacterium]
MNTNSFTVYNASAGSGKTFTLVKEYLKTLFLSHKIDKYKNILAVTFTNKAVAEMKGRILENLKAFADPEILLLTVPENLMDQHQMFSVIANELELDTMQLHKKAIRIQDAILNNYAAFDIVTIDTFTHRIIRTFAYDLKLPQNFEVALDTEDVLQEAIANVLMKVGEDKRLTKLLIDFALHKADDDKSWDIALDLYRVSRLLLNENEVEHVSKLKDKSLEDFDKLKETLEKKLTHAKNEIVSQSKGILNNFESKCISENDIKSVFGYFSKLAKEEFSIKYGLVWQAKLLNGETLYPKRVSGAVADSIDEMQSDISSVFLETKTLFSEVSFLKNFLKSIVPLSVLNVVNKELQSIKEEQNILLISEFNKIISNEIKGQPTPFIYERIGERYQNYFIDEFQDTSQMQWQNLIPLTENALLTEPKPNEQHSLLIVGDAKQAIYRWRGGKPEQFIDLYEDENPFYIEKSIENLDTNYRSYSEVVEFNNNFFSFLSHKFQNETHQELYRIGNNQKQNNKKGGFVKVSFVENVLEEDAIVLYQEKVLETIENVLEQGFVKADICIVTRKKKDGIAIADFLTEKGISIISSETLLVNKSKEVRFIISFLTYLLHPENKNSKMEFLNYLYAKLEVVSSEHEFYIKLLQLPPFDIFKELAISYQIQFDYETVQTLPFYELVEQIIRAFYLVSGSDAYVQYFLDEVLSFSQKKQTGVQGFLEYWELKKDKLSIVAPEGANAITLMTIHKSKGLEFPVIIFPFAELDIYKEQDSKTWYPINEEEYNGFSEAYLHFNKEIETYGDIGERLWKERRAQLELDNINLLYVALTRPKEQLYVISKKAINKKTGDENENLFSGFFIGFLKQIGKWQEDVDDYEFGEMLKLSIKTEIKEEKELLFTSSSRLDHNLAILAKAGFLWNSEQGDAIEKGNLIHLILSKIKYRRDVDIVFQELVINGIITTEQEELLKPVLTDLINNSEVSVYFNDDLIVFNERAILTKDGKTLIPDRIVFKEKTATVIDYKTGSFDLKHEAQVNTYASVLLDMGYEVDKKLLVYLDDKIKIREVS